tara:strand:+ start:215 stop:859 length:645 start_codon:yes stop_codon:yes gene_type:complete
MKINLSVFLNFIISISILLFFLYFVINYISKKPTIINFIHSDINTNFEIDITDNLNNINNYLKNFEFIESYLLKKNKNEINIKIKLKKVFAKNNSIQEIIFFDNTTAPFNYFKSTYLDNIDLIDISNDAIYINRYLSDNYQKLASIFNISQIEYIDDRRYNLVLSSGTIIMLPKVIDSDFINFIQNNIEIINKNTNYDEFLDLRNFHKKSIRLK